MGTNTYNRRDLCKARLRLIDRLMKWAFQHGFTRIFEHYKDCWMIEFQNYQTGKGRYV